MMTPGAPLNLLGRTLMRWWWIGLVLAGLVGGGTLTPAGEKTSEGGRALFNGKDLTGWKFRGDPDKAKAKSKWSVVGDVALAPDMPGRLAGKPGTGVLLNGDDG